MPDKPKDIKRAVNAFDAYFGTPKEDPRRGHFRKAVAFVAANCPALTQEILKSGALTGPQIDNARKGNRTGASDDSRIQTGKVVCAAARTHKLPIPESLITTLGIN